MFKSDITWENAQIAEAMTRHLENGPPEITPEAVALVSRARDARGRPAPLMTDEQMAAMVAHLMEVGKYFSDPPTPMSEADAVAYVARIQAQRAAAIDRFKKDEE